MTALLISAMVTFTVVTWLADGIGRLGFPLPPHERRLGAIDGLRGYLALCVMVHHFFMWSSLLRLTGAWGRPPFHVINELGAGGVALFFMTTGLVFYPRVLTGLRATPWITVYISRVFRIMPLVIVSFLIVTAIVVARTRPAFDIHYATTAVHWITANGEPPVLGYPDSKRINASVLWSLHYEWLFYFFMLPVCAGAMDLVRAWRMPTWLLPLTLLAVAIAVRVVVEITGHSVELLWYLPLFLIGMLAYEIQANKDLAQKFRGGIVGVIAVLSLGSGMMLADYPYQFALPLFGFFFICVACGNDLGGILSFRGALVLGECSFGIYLLHGIVLNILFVDGNAYVSRVSTAVLPALLVVPAIVVVLVTGLTFLLVERPAMRTGKQLGRWISAQRVRLVPAREISGG